MKKKVLITGATGFAGSHLAELLVSQNTFEVFGMHISDRHLSNLFAIKEHIKLFKVDLLNHQEVSRIIAEVSPDIVFHLAASTSVAESFKNPTGVITNNVTSEINVLEALRQQHAIHTKVIIISSSHIYGIVSPVDLPIDEATPFQPDNPYSISKITQDYLGLSYYLSYRLPIIRIRPFNHIGPRLSPDISISRFARTIAEIEKGKQEPIMRVGNLSTKRDFTDVRDVVRAYALAVDACSSGDVYNVGSGVSYFIEEMLQELLSFSTVKIAIEPDQALFRPSDIPELRADATKFIQATGWKPEIPIKQTLRDTLDYWRNIV